MKVIARESFDRDTDKISSKELRTELDDKIIQIEKAKSKDNITGLKMLEGFTHHYRILVKTEKRSYRIGAIIRGDTIWLIRFLPRKKVYDEFP